MATIVPASILESVKKVLGLTTEYVSFDIDIVMHINTVFSTLTQMGVGPAEGFTITGYTETWSQFVTSDVLKTQQVQSYLPLKVKSIFDPSPNANITEAMKRSISEMEYRLYVEEENARYAIELAAEELLEEEDIDE